MDNNSKQLTFASIIIAGGLVAAAMMFTGGSSSGGLTKPGLKEFDVVMENNRYKPSTLTVNVGDTVIINFENKDAVSHAVEIPEFNGTVSGGHVPAGGTAQMKFVADRKVSIDAAVCGGPVATDKTDDHGEELIFNVI